MLYNFRYARPPGPYGKGIAQALRIGDHGIVVVVSVEPLDPVRAEEIPRAFAPLGWPGKDAKLYRRYLAEQDKGMRTALVASAFRRSRTSMCCPGFVASTSGPP